MVREAKRLQFVLTLVLLSLFSTHTHGVGSGGVCAGCPMTQKVVDAEHLEMINKAFQVVKEKNGNAIIGVKASLVPDSFQTQVVAGTKFMFTLQTNAGEHIKFTVFRSLPSWGGADNNSGTVTYTVSEAVITSSVVHHATDGGPNDLVVGPDRHALRGPIALKNLPSWTKVVASSP